MAEHENYDEETLARLDKEMRDYQQAIKEEYEVAEKNSTELEQSIENSVEYFRKNANHASAMIVFLMENSTSDSVRLNAAKYVVERMHRGKADSPGDPVADIINNLMKIPKPADESHVDK